MIWLYGEAMLGPRPRRVVFINIMQDILEKHEHLLLRGEQGRLLYPPTF